MNSISRRRFLKTGAALALGACAPPLLRAQDHKDHFDWTLHKPEEVGMSQAGLEGIRAAIQKNVDNKVIAGAVTAVARHNKLVWYEAQGLRDVSSNVAQRKDDIFRMASSTKTVTAVAVLVMMDEGKISLDDPVSRFIPEFNGQKVAVAKDASGVDLVVANREITIRDLLTHTSGLGSSGDSPAPAAGSRANTIVRQPNDTLGDFIPRLGSAALAFQPGTKWRYSPLDGFDTLLRIVEITSGQTGDVFLKERIFEPLEMRDTAFNLTDKNQDRLTGLYSSQNGQFKVEKHLLGEGPYKYFSGAGGLFSTAHDFMQFEAMLLNQGTLNGRRILKAETVQLMVRNHVGNLFAEWIPAVTAGHGFGLGVRIVEDRASGGGRGVGAFGWGGAYGTESWVDPESDVAAVLFIQMRPGPANVRPDFQQALRNAIVT
ncbi:MAG: serine hydrolase domain-containing protein [Planctomycetaceae bacterium]